MITTDNCFENAEFTAWWDEVDAVVLDTMEPCYSTFDDGPILDILIDLYNEGCPVPDAANEAIEAYQIGQAEAWMGVPSWA
jgi:hypothetical protein